MVTHIQKPEYLNKKMILVGGLTALAAAGLMAWQTLHPAPARLPESHLQGRAQTTAPVSGEAKATPAVESAATTQTKSEKGSTVTQHNSQTKTSDGSTKVNISNQSRQTGGDGATNKNYSSSTTSLKTDGQNTTIQSTTIDGKNTTKITH